MGRAHICMCNSRAYSYRPTQLVLPPQQCPVHNWGYGEGPTTRPTSLCAGTRCCCLAFGMIPQTGAWDLLLEGLAHPEAAHKPAALKRVIDKGGGGDLHW